MPLFLDDEAAAAPFSLDRDRVSLKLSAEDGAVDDLARSLLEHATAAVEWSLSGVVRFKTVTR